MFEKINYKKLRKDLIEKAENFDPDIDWAIDDVIEVEEASDKELLRMAKEAGLDLRKYK